MKLLCRLIGHDRLASGSRHRVCLRCGQRETLRRFGHVIAWEELTGSTLPGSDA